MERKTDQKTEKILWEISEKMDVLYSEQICQMSVSDMVQKLMERTA